jgi:hypothetical protein
MRRAISSIKSQAVLELGCAFLRGSIGKRFAKHVFFGRGSFPDVRFNMASNKIGVIDEWR